MTAARDADQWVDDVDFVFYSIPDLLQDTIARMDDDDLREHAETVFRYGHELTSKDYRDIAHVIGQPGPMAERQQQLLQLFTRWWFPGAANRELADSILNWAEASERHEPDYDSPLWQLFHSPAAQRLFRRSRMRGG